MGLEEERFTAVVRLNGRITIPAVIREVLGIEDGDTVTVKISKKEVKP